MRRIGSPIRQAGVLVVLSLAVLLAVGVASADAARTSAEFKSPSRNIACQMTTTLVICLTQQPTQKATVDRRGKVVACRGSLKCAGNPGEGVKVLGYGKSVRVGGFRCTVRMTGVTCVRVASGKGFRIARSGIKRLP